MRTATLTIVTLLLLCNAAAAQYGGGYGSTRSRLNSLNNSPTVSPYLNLITDNVNDIDAISGRYQTLVRPQFESQRALSRTQQSIYGLQNQLNQIQLNTSLPSQTRPLGFQLQGYTVTGHPSYFRTYSHYYPLR